MIPNRSCGLNLAENSRSDFPEQLDDGCPSALGPGLADPASVPLLLPPLAQAAEMPASQQLSEAGRKAWRRQVAPPVPQRCQLRQLGTGWEKGGGAEGQKQARGWPVVDGSQRQERGRRGAKPLQLLSVRGLAPPKGLLESRSAGGSGGFTQKFKWTAILF